MWRITFLSIIFVLSVSVYAMARPVSGYAYSERDNLVFLLGQEVTQFIRDGKLSAEDRQTAAKITMSLFSDRPLKPIEEIIRQGQQGAMQVKNDDGHHAYEKIMKDKEVQDVLKRMRTRARPSPTPTQYQAHDLKRLLDLKAALKRSRLRSKAADKLYDLIIVQIEQTTVS